MSKENSMEDVVLTEMNVALMVSDIIKDARALGFKIAFTGEKIVMIGAVNIDLMHLLEARAFLEGCAYYEEYVIENGGEDDI